MAKLCQVCTTAEAKYKCPGCRTPYCSAACYKAHKEVPCAPAAPAVPAQAAATTSSNGQPSAGGSSSSQQQPSLSAQKTSADQQEELVVDASQLLSLEQLDGLRALPIMHKSLEDPAMRALLTKIDASGNRLKELEKALLNPAFASFMYQTLDEVAAKSAQGLAG
ncbi:putative mynd zn-finger protein/hormone receptor interactor [Globisporangium polare]